LTFNKKFEHIFTYYGIDSAKMKAVGWKQEAGSREQEAGSREQEAPYQ
jgi:hypothetical protein